MLSGTRDGLGPAGRADPQPPAPPCLAPGRARGPRGDAPGHAHPGPAVRARADDRAGDRARAKEPGAGLPLLLRHAGRGGEDGTRRPALLPLLPGFPAADRGRCCRHGCCTTVPACRSSSRPCTRATSSRSWRRLQAELLPRIVELAKVARERNIQLTVDAEESERLEPSLDLFQALARDESLAGWHGLGLAVQAYQKRAVHVIAWLTDLARSSSRQVMVRLVKGAYWDSEVKRAQQLGLADYPVFTRKVATDVSYLACAKRLLDGGDFFYPAFATHNAQTIACLIEMAGNRRGGFEFQKLHGMGEALYRDLKTLEHVGHPGPGLCARGQPQGAPALPRPPPARERGQQLLRPPGGRPRDLARRADRRPGGQAGPAGAEAAPLDPPPARPLPAGPAERARDRPQPSPPARATWSGSSTRLPDPATRPAPASLGGKLARHAVRDPSDRRHVAGRGRLRRCRRHRARHRPRPGRLPGLEPRRPWRSAPRSSTVRPTSWPRTPAASSISAAARAAAPSPIRSPTGARRSTSSTTTPPRPAASWPSPPASPAPPARRTGWSCTRAACSSPSAPGTSRSPSSPASSRPPSPPATASSPSPPRPPR